jgi:RNA polymerase sigma-54 factor
MSGRTVLGLSARAGLALTPEVRLALELLHLPGPELRARIEREAAANPLLEIEAETAEAADEAEAADQEGAAYGEPGPAGTPVADGREDPRDDAPAGSAAGGEDADGMTEARRPEDGALPRGVLEIHSGESPERPEEATLAAHLESQFRLEASEPDVLAAGEYLVGCLDERGYLGVTADQAACEAGLPPAAVDAALRLLRTLDPPGIGARDLRDCLLLQLQARGREGTLTWRIVAERFGELAGGRHVNAARGLAARPEEVRRALAEIRTLRPHPGRLVGGGPVRYIYPDLSVLRVDGRWQVQVDDRTVPRVRCAAWGREWAGAETDPSAQAAVRERFAAARRLVRALERRRGTLVRVMESILEEQGEFFERGAAFLRPMSMRTVAGRLGLHESTVARVVRSKYAQTPRGLLPLRFFFSGGLRTEHGPDASSRAVRARIGAYIEEEERVRPLTDAEIARRLAGEGIRIARRTVAKYRVSMRIERAQRRRAPAGHRVRPRARDARPRPRAGHPS